MLDDLLVTKLFIPSPRSTLVPRARLFEQLEQGVRSNNRLGLICAPAGFGKTTLVAQWLSQLAHPADNDARAAWLSLDDSDNDPALFLAYFALALQRFSPHLGESAVVMLRSAQPPPLQSILTSLLNDIAYLGTEDGQQSRRVLVLDDYHLITAPAVHDAVTFLLEHLPPTVQLVIVSRSDPPLPLPRFRARDQITEIRQADLRFTAAEATAFLNNVMSVALAEKEVAALTSRTEGWIAGLQLAALSMRGRDDVANFIETFSGSHRFVMDYLAEEVLGRQDVETRRFLYQTVILDRLTASLCDAVTGRTDSQRILAQMEQDNLFIVPLDYERRWYRYHHLFADLLRQRLDEKQQADIPQLHRRAAEWYERHGDISEAISHWLARGDPAQAARLMQGNAIQTLNRGEMSTVIGWLTSVPPELIRSRPWLSVARAWTSLLGGKIEGIAADLQNAAQAVADTGHEASTEHVRGHTSAIQAYLTLMMGDVAAAANHAREALQTLPKADASTRSVVTYTLGGACLMNEDIEGAHQAFAEAGASALEAGNIHLAAAALSALGMLQVQFGRLRLALDTFDKAQQVASGKDGRAFPIAAGAYNGKGLLHYERNELAAAADCLQTAVELANAWGNADSMVSSHVLLARVYLAQSDGDRALALLQEADGVAHGSTTTVPSEALLAAQWMVALLAEGDVTSATRRAAERGLAAEDRLSYVREVEFIALARLFLAQDECDQALALLARLLLAAEAGGRMGRVVEILTLQAVALQARADDERAADFLQQALDMAEPEGYVRTFVDAGPPVRGLLERVAARGSVPAYVGRLLAAFPDPEQPAASAPATPLPDYMDTLSDHELDVLRLVAAGLTNREAAEELYVSVNTVKWHLKQIYEKLDVHSRIAAVTRAQELRLL